jgi:hypothetical protein
MLEIGGLPVSKFMVIYFFGALIILLYAKDKFNMPTYDKDAMGPFAQLPPQDLTIDARYQWGRTVYIVLMLCLYTAISVVGPTSFSNLMAGAGPVATSIIPGAGNAEVWPVAAAAFLISTGAANDNNFLGRVELLIRQYAQRSAYIPTTVSDLAFTLRTVSIKQWLISNPYIDESELGERQKVLAVLVGADNLAKIKENPKQEGQLAAWVRANILFYTLQQMFNKRPGFSSAKMEYLTDLPENVEIFNGLRAKREALVLDFKSGMEQADYETGRVFAEVQRFSKDTSLMIAVLLSQTARNTSYLTEHLDRLGFQGVDLRDRSDHFTYTIMVNAFIVAGSLLVALVLAAAWLPAFTPYMTWIHNIGLARGAITIFSGTLVYLVMFKATDYWRERLLDTLVWREDLQSYVKLTLKASFLSCSASVVLLVLVLFLFNSVDIVINGPVLFAQVFVSYLIVAALGTAFGLIYLRQAARLPADQLSLPANLLNSTALLHGLLAAVFVVALNTSTYLFNTFSAPMDAASVVKATWEKAAQDPKGGFAGRYDSQQLKAIGNKIDDLPASLDQMDLGEPTMSQQAAVGSICALVNAPHAAVDGAGSPSQPTSGTAAAPSDAIFADPNLCQIKGGVSADDPRLPIAILLKSLQSKLADVEHVAEALYFVWTFPALAAFLIAYCFGVSCRYWRAWWLNNDEDYLTELKGQIRLSYGNDIDVNKCLTWPVGLLGNVTPIEAVRYEDYRSKLLANVQRQKIVWPESFYTRGTVASAEKAGAISAMAGGMASIAQP